MKPQFFLKETKDLTKISYKKKNGPNEEIKYFEFDFSMIKKNT